LAVGAALDVKADSGSRVFAAAFDARQNEAYVGFYQMRAGVLHEIMPDALVKPDGFDLAGIAREFDLTELVLTGPGWQAYPSLQADAEPVVVADDFDRLPQAIDLLSLAEQGYRSGELTDAFAAQPNYLRDKVTD
jgi:tRNA threonylcarbamoyladenosine biosynthesis protein TsaB